MDSITLLILTVLVPVGALAGLGFTLRHLWKVRDTLPLDSPVKTAVAYAKDHPLAAIMLLASVALSVVSFWNTWIGMSEVLGSPVMALMATIGIQGLMLVYAWKLGFDMFGRNGGGGRMSVVFGLCAYFSAMALSSGFATVRMFDVMFDENQRELWSEVRTEGAIRDVLGDLTELNRLRLAQQRGVIESEESGWPAVERNLRALNQQDQALRQSAQADAAAAAALLLQAEQARIARSTNLSQLELEKAQIDARVISLTDRLTDRQTRLDAWETEFGPLRDNIALLERQRKQEVAGELSSGRSGCGVKCEAIDERLNPLQQQFEAGPKQAFERLESERNASDVELEQARARQINLNARIQTLQAEATIGPTGPTPAAEAEEQALAAQRIAEVGSLIDLAIAFRSNPTLVDFDILQTQCTIIENNAPATAQAQGPRAPGQDANEGRCGLASVEPTALRYATLNEGRIYLAENCSLDNLETTADAGERVGSMGVLARTCVDRAGLLSSDISASRAEVISIIRNRSADSPKFSLIQMALLDGEKLAWLAVIIALLIDLMVLLTALLAVLVNIDPMQKAGMRRNDAIAVRNALESDPTVKPRDLSQFILKAQAGPSVQAPGFTRLDTSGHKNEQLHLLQGVINVANAAQYRNGADNSSIVTYGFGLVVLTIILLLTGLHPRTVLALVLVCLFLYPILHRLGLLSAIEMSSDSGSSPKFPKDANGDPVHMVHVSVTSPANRQEGPQEEIAISGMFLQALQIVSNESVSNLERLKSAISDVGSAASSSGDRRRGRRARSGLGT